MIWAGKTVAVLASGPSLTIDDVEIVRQSGVITIAVNNTWEIAPWCDVIFAGDFRWWQVHAAKIDSPAKRFSRSSNAEKKYGAKYYKTKLGNSYNSGQMAIEFAVQREAERVIMLGFDCSIKHGVHHHGDHVKTPNPNESRCQMWKKQFIALREYYSDADIVNCSRYTEIDAFPLVPLEDALCGRG